MEKFGIKSVSEAQLIPATIERTIVGWGVRFAMQAILWWKIEHWGKECEILRRIDDIMRKESHTQATKRSSTVSRLLDQWINKLAQTIEREIVLQTLCLLAYVLRPAYVNVIVYAFNAMMMFVCYYRRHWAAYNCSVRWVVEHGILVDYFQYIDDENRCRDELLLYFTKYSVVVNIILTETNEHIISEKK